MKSKLLKRIGTVFMALAVAMTMGASTAVFAADVDTGDVLTVKNVEDNATVTAYKIIKEKNGKWVTENGVSITIPDPLTDTWMPTADEIKDVTNAIISKTFTASKTYELKQASGEKDYKTTETVEAGMYLVLVTGGKNVYNPMIVSADYDKVADVVDAKTNYSTAYAKMSEPAPDKTVSGAKEGTSGHGGSAQVGDVLDFTVTAAIPSYSKVYEQAMFQINDALTKGLKIVGDVTVKVGGTEVAADSGAYTIKKEDSGFTIDFAQAYLLGDGNGKAVEVTYQAKVQDDADFNFDPNTNKATLKYSNNPKDKTDTKEKEINTYTYTFGIDANLSAKNVTGNVKTHDVIKLDENGNIQQTDTFTDDTSESTVTHALEGAVFTVYTDEACKNPVKKVSGENLTGETSTNGYMEITGLKEGTYYLKETAVPDGYTMLKDPVKVEISADYYTDGKLKSYSIKINGTETSNFSATYDQSGDPVITKTKGDTVYIKNTKVPGLPSTGGIGTYIFTIIGVAIMAMAALMFRRRNKSAKDAQ